MASKSKLIKPPGNSDDLRRILALPSRTWSDHDAARVAEYLTRQLLTPKGLEVLSRFDLLAPSARAEAIAEFSRETCPILLSGDQAIILYEFVQLRGALTLAPVGAGKTLLLWLAWALAEKHFGMTRGVIMMPAYLYDDALAAHEIYSEYWQAPRVPPKLITYNELGTESHAFELCDCEKCRNGAELDPEVTYVAAYRPTFVGLDEADTMASEDSAGAARHARFQRTHRDELVTIAATGTLVQDSLSEMFLLFEATLKERAPIPYEYVEQQRWCAALDPMPKANRIASPEHLIRAFGGDLNADDPRQEARRAFGRRLKTTPGFIVINKSSCDTRVHIRAVPAPRDTTIEDAMIPFRLEGKALDGHIIGDTLSKTAYEESVSMGYFDKWDPRPPIEWLDARNAYNKLVAEAIKNSTKKGRVPIETEKQARRVLRDTDELRLWLEISTGPDAFVPNPVPVAVSLSVINWVAEWLRINSPAIVWVDGTWLGETLEAVTGVPYYAKNGLSSAKRAPRPGESIIASLKSNWRGRNWWRWNRNLVATVLASNKWHEQVIGRTHRQGQQSDVFVDYLVTCHGSLRAFEKAQERARGTQDFFDMTQKIIASEWDWSAVPRQILDPEGSGVTDHGFLARWHPKRLGELVEETEQ